MDHQVYELMTSKLESIHDDLRALQTSLNQHIQKDEEQYRHIWFIRRAFQAMWAGIAAWLSYLGLKS